MAKVPNAVEILPKIWTAWVGRTNVTDRRQTDRRQTTDGRQHMGSLKMDHVTWPRPLGVLCHPSSACIQNLKT